MGALREEPLKRGSDNLGVEPEMERFKPLLNYILVELRVILAKNEGYMLSWDVVNLRSTGDDLIRLAHEAHPQLAKVEHRVLHRSLRDAGLGMRMRALEVQKRRLEERDKAYFREVHEALKNICEKIETGEYYRALVKVRDSKMTPNRP